MIEKKSIKFKAPQSSIVQGRSETRTEAYYIVYAEGVLELLTKQYADNTSRVGGFATEQASMVGRFGNVC